MTTPPPTSLYKRHRFPAEMISHGVWLYSRLCPSDRGVEALMAARGLILTDEAMRYWYRKFGQTYANALHHCRPRLEDESNRDEIFRPSKGIPIDPDLDWQDATLWHRSEGMPVPAIWPSSGVRGS